jgi:uncharacterized membrane protein YoaK (UPF0700 family)
MPLDYLSTLTAKPRSRRANLHMGVLLTMVAGALNAGGFLAVGQYTSHMTGMVSTLADQLVLWNLELVSVALVSWFAFVIGAASTAILVNAAQRRGLNNIYAQPLLLEALCILGFGAFGGALRAEEFADVSIAVIVLCFAMGLQNALITKISSAEIRTTHVTGLTTDFGIELGKLLYWNRKSASTQIPMVLANRKMVKVHALLIGTFFLGGVLGALGFKYVGFASSIPLALVLGLIALAPAMGSRHR